MLKIIDAHTHLDYLNRNNNYAYYTTMKDLLEILGDHNIDKAICSQMPYSSEYTNISRGKKGDFSKIPFLLSNVLLLEEKDKYDQENIIIPFFNIHPKKKLTEQLKYIEDLLKEGQPVQGIKYHCQATDTHISSIDNIDLINFCKEWKLPILLHTGVSKNWNANNVLEFIKRTEGINFSIAHLGRLHEKFREQLKLQGIPKNLFIDLSPYFLVYKTQKIKKCKPGINIDNISEIELLIQICNSYPENIIWGTDYPFIKDSELHPTGNYKENINLLESLPINTRKKICVDNIIRFLGKDKL